MFGNTFQLIFPVKKQTIFFCLLLLSAVAHSQELFVFADPASVLPANALAIKFSDHYMPYDRVYDRPSHRLFPEISLGISKKLMMSAGGSFSDMHTYKVKPESFFGYAKYRFLSLDDIHRHFRMAAFVQGGYTAAPFHYDETSLMGDKSGIRAGIITTQLWHRFALSGTVSHTQVLDKSRNDKVIYLPRRIYQAMNYALSTGCLLLPRQYTGYKQVNLSLYLELLAQQALDYKSHYIDIAPAVQFIFFSNTKLNIGYRTQVWGNAQRMSEKSWLISVERSFLNMFHSNKNK